jgi:hypothetical protein
MSKNRNRPKQQFPNKAVNKTEEISVTKPNSNFEDEEKTKVKTDLEKYYSAEKEKKDNELQQYFKDMIEIYDEQKNAELIKLKQELLTQNQETVNEYRKKISRIEEEKTILAKQQLNLSEELLAIETKKRNIEIEIAEKFGNEIKDLTSSVDDLINLNKDLSLKLKEKERKLTSLENDRLFYEEEVENLLKLKQEITKLNIDVQTRKEENQIYRDRFDECNRELTRLKAKLDEIGVEPLKAIEENKSLKNQLNMLKDEFAQYPSIYEIESLRKSFEIKQKLEYEKEVWSKERTDYVSQLTELSHYKEEIENQRRFIKIIELQKAELKSELDNVIDLYNKRSSKVFASLSLIDNEKSVLRNTKSGKKLKELCADFRTYLASRKDKVKLYYSEEIIRTFVAGLSSSKLSILEGLSGTGKSSLPRAFADFINCKVITVPVQSSWKDRNDLLGYYNDFKKQYKETEFLKAIYKAANDINTPYIIVLDEMNLSRIEYYFADFLSVLEKDDENEWYIDLIPDNVGGDMPKLIHDGKLKITPNIWFVGTANKDDSTFVITDKVYDRSVVIDFSGKEKAFGGSSIPSVNIDFPELSQLLTDASRFKSGNKIKEYAEDCVGFLDDAMTQYFEITFGNRLLNQLERFVPTYIECGGTYLEAIDIVFSKKVLRKLHGRYDELTKKNLELLKEEIINRNPKKEEFSNTKLTIDKLLKEIG